MAIVSYSQDFKDVLLWPALFLVGNGEFVDVAAENLQVDSFNKPLSARECHGEHLEPTPHHALLCEQRPGGTMLQAAMTSQEEVVQFPGIRIRGISTADASIADQFPKHGFAVCKVIIPCISLGTVFQCAESAEHSLMMPW